LGSSGVWVWSVMGGWCWSLRWAGDIIGVCVVGQVVLHVCGRGGLALCAMSVFLPFWLVYPIKGSIVSTSMLFEPRWISIPWEYFWWWKYELKKSPTWTQTKIRVVGAISQHRIVTAVAWHLSCTLRGHRFLILIIAGQSTKYNSCPPYLMQWFALSSSYFLSLWQLVLGCLLKTPGHLQP
jgi:hypothetical protein